MVIVQHGDDAENLVMFHEREGGVERPQGILVVEKQILDIRQEKMACKYMGTVRTSSLKCFAQYGFVMSEDLSKNAVSQYSIIKTNNYICTYKNNKKKGYL